MACVETIHMLEAPSTIKKGGVAPQYGLGFECEDIISFNHSIICIMRYLQYVCLVLGEINNFLLGRIQSFSTDRQKSRNKQLENQAQILLKHSTLLF